MSVTAEATGGQVACPHCQQTLQIPAAETSRPANRVPPVVRPASQSTPTPTTPASPAVSGQGENIFPAIRKPTAANASSARVRRPRRKSSTGGLLAGLGSVGGVVLVVVVIALKFGIRQYADSEYEADCEESRREAYQRFASFGPAEVVKSIVDRFHADCAAGATHGVKTSRLHKSEYFEQMQDVFTQFAAAAEESLSPRERFERDRQEVLQRIRARSSDGEN